MKNVIYILHLYCEEEVLKHLENKVKIARIQVDLTQQQLAEKIGVTRQTISLIEKGKYNPTLKLCLDICYAVNKTLDEVFWIEREDNE